MKKYLGFLIALSILAFVGLTKVEATNDIGCNGGTMYSPITGQLCNNYSNGCTAGSLYSATTGQLCSNTNSSFSVVSPNGGEVYQAGQQVIVKWNPGGYSSSAKVSIALATLDSSGSSSNTFLIDVNNLKNDGIETITIPVNTPGASNYVMYLTIFESSNKWQSDRSDNAFTVRSNNEIAPITKAPSITILSPNGGEVYQTGQQIELKWKTNNIPKSYKVIFTLREPIIDSSYGSLAYTENDGSELITLPTSSEFSTIKYGNYFKISARVEVPAEENLNIQDDFSDNFFTINSNNNDVDPSPNVPSITVLSPNGGETFTAGKKMTVTWDTNNFNGLSNDVIIALHQNGEWENVVYLSGSTKNDGSETFVIPNIVTGNYKIRVGHASASVKQDFSDSTFFIKENSTNPSVCSSNNQPSITVLSPNKGESFIKDQQAYIKWESCNVQNVWIGLASGGKDFGLITPNPVSASQGHYRWTVSNPSKSFTNLDRNNYQIYVESQSPNILGKSGVFTVSDSYNDDVDVDEGCKSGAFYSLTTGKPCSNNKLPSITVLSPNGGEVYRAGQQIPIRWSTINIPAGVKITPVLNYVDNAYNETNIVKSISLDPVSNTGSAIITIPNSILVKSGKYYEISLVYEISTSELGALIRDRSDGLFTINSLNPNETAPSVIIHKDCANGSLYSSTTGLKCPVTSVAPATTNSNLMKGARSNEVKTVQSALTKQGYTLSSDGVFGPKTEEAVKKFQAMKGLPVTGIIDDTTMSMILSYILGL